MGPAPPGAVVVPAALGDSLFERRTLDLVKIDVQGWELEVLAGLSATLARSFGSSLSSGRAPSSSARATAGRLWSDTMRRATRCAPWSGRVARTLAMRQSSRCAPPRVGGDKSIFSSRVRDRDWMGETPPRAASRRAD